MIFEIDKEKYLSYENDKTEILYKTELEEKVADTATLEEPTDKELLVWARENHPIMKIINETKEEKEDAEDKLLAISKVSIEKEPILVEPTK